MADIIRRKSTGEAWETVEDTGGSGSVTPPVTLTGTDPAQAVLTLEADPAQTELVFRVYDDSGDLAVDIDAQGRLDTRSYNVQDPPDSGSGPVVAVQPGIVTIHDDGANDPLVVVDTSDAFRPYFTVKRGGVSNIVQVEPASGVTGVEVIAAVGQTAALIDAWDNPFNIRLFAVLPDGAVLTSQNAAPADGDLNAGEVALWFDDTNGASKLMIKGKSADGTVVTGLVALI